MLTTDETRTAPWQLKAFSKSLKKNQKLQLLLRQAGKLEGKKCFLITHGDNNGALNYHFREAGGEWVFAENEAAHIREIESFLKQPVLKCSPERVPGGDAEFDLVVSIDVHEHLEDCTSYNRELCRVVRPGGTVVVTTPTSDPWKPVTLLKHLVGMRREQYGHRVLGYSIREHEKLLSAVGLEPVASSSYSKFFTELLELVINFAYVKVIRRSGPSEGSISPVSSSGFRSVGTAYRLYSAVYPIFWALSQLDRLLFMFKGYAVSVVARRPR